MIDKIFAKYRAAYVFLVLKSNNIPFFRKFNSIFYFAAIGLSKAFFSDKRIESIYLIHGLTKKGWFPGDSDLDLCLVSGALSFDEKVLLQKRCAVFLGISKILFPFAIELQVLPSQSFNNKEILWRLFESREHSLRDWILVWGKKQDLALNEKKILFPLSFKFGFWHNRLFLKYFFEQDFSKKIFARNYFKISKNVCGFLEFYAPKKSMMPKNPELIKKASNVLESKGFWLSNSQNFLLKQFFLQFQAYDFFYSSVLPKTGNVSLNSAAFSEFSKTNAAFFENLQKICGFFEKFDLHSIVLVPKTFFEKDFELFFVLEDGISESGFSEIVLEVKMHYSELKNFGIFPAIVSKSMIAGEFYFMPNIEPFCFKNFVENAMVLHGKKIDFLVSPPDEWLFEKAKEYLLFYEAFLSWKSFSRMNFLGRNSAVSTDFFKLLSCRLFLEKGIIVVSKKELIEKATDCFSSEKDFILFLNDFQNRAFDENISQKKALKAFFESEKLFSKAFEKAFPEKSV